MAVGNSVFARPAGVLGISTHFGGNGAPKPREKIKENRAKKVLARWCNISALPSLPTRTSNARIRQISVMGNNPGSRAFDRPEEDKVKGQRDTQRRANHVRRGRC